MFCSVMVLVLFGVCGLVIGCLVSVVCVCGVVCSVLVVFVVLCLCVMWCGVFRSVLCFVPFGFFGVH